MPVIDSGFGSGRSLCKGANIAPSWLPVMLRLGMSSYWMVLMVGMVLSTPVVAMLTVVEMGMAVV